MPLRFFLLAFCILSAFHATAQVHVTLLLDTNNLKTGEPVYAAGNINNWNPADTQYRFTANNILSFIVVKNDIIEYKITRGLWNTVESNADGSDIINRVFKANNDTTIIIKVAAWKDAFPVPVRKHTASVNVSVLDSAFYIPQLKRSRTIRIYLPPDYKVSGKNYPVLYMQDGQNCFDEFTGNFGEWHIDEALDHFYDSCKKSMIVVAVDHGQDHRIQEYNPYEFEKFGKGEGKQYVDFLAQTLKPYIDKNFRTLEDKSHTHIAGSSMGGVISTWAIVSYPQVYGSAGIFSPAFWTSGPMYAVVRKSLSQLKGSSFFFYAGGKESNTMIPYTEEMYLLLKTAKGIKTKMQIDEDAQHNEAAWTRWFPVYLQWIMR